ncbi:MAG TPA: ATP-binding protein [Terriglobales bacterium]|nr:ATP-binding protein [Terriglobales bacterium]
MILLLHPVLAKVLLATISVLLICVLGALAIHRLASGITKLDRAPGISHDALAAYESVIHRLRHQEQQLEILRRAESDRAQKSESISTAIIANLSSGVLLFNTDGLVQQANDSVHAILDLPASTGCHARDIFRGVKQLRKENGEVAGSALFLAQAIDSTLHDGTTYRRLEADYHCEAGDRVLGLTISPVRRQDSNIIGAACLISDLTEVTRLARDMRLRESLAAMGEISGGLATQFQKSLAIISSFAQKLTMEDDMAAVRQHAFRITAETKKMARTLDDFREIAQGDASADEQVELRTLLEDCARESKVNLIATDVDDSLFLRGNPATLRHAFSNLLRNSAEAARNGRPVRVEVSTKTDGDQTRIVLRDDGVGIKPENLSKLCSPFFTTKPEGTGLGLALVHRVVTQLGGKLEISSDASGATFTISIPAVRRVRAAAMV